MSTKCHGNIRQGTSWRVLGRQRLLLPMLLALAFAPQWARGLTIEAEQARIITAGKALEDGWVIDDIGDIRECLRIEKSGPYRIAVRVRATAKSELPPVLGVSIDTAPVQQMVVDQTEFQEFQFTLELDAGLRTVAVALLNIGPGRNIVVDRIEVHGAEDSPEPKLAGTKEYAEDYRRAEAQALQQARVDIERLRKGPASIRVLDEQGKPVPGAKVRVEQVRHAFLFGCNFFMFDQFPEAAANERYKELFADVFNYAVVPFLWITYERERGKPNHAYTDRYVAWCRERGIRLKGTPILWNFQLGVPPWAERMPGPNVLKQHVDDIVGRYAGKIDKWEIVNEPWHLPGLDIEAPYRWAREADPNGYLMVNDYQVMTSGLPGYYQIIRQALNNGVPIDGIGIQGHDFPATRFRLDHVRNVLNLYATLNKELHITEFTPPSKGRIKGILDGGEWTEAAQAEFAEGFYRVCFAHPAMASISWWDMTDLNAWQPDVGLVRRDLSPKPAYEALRRLIKEEWMTKTDGTTDRQGLFFFRGFYGTYRILVTFGGRTAEHQLTLERGADNHLRITRQASPTNN